MKKAGKVDEKQAALQALGELGLHLPNGDAFAKLVDAKGVLAKVAAEDANEERRVREVDLKWPLIMMSFKRMSAPVCSVEVRHRPLLGSTTAVGT